MLKLVIFDLDQTLLNTLPRFHKIFNMSLKHFNCNEVNWDIFIVNYKDDTLNKFVCVGRKKFWDYFLEHYNDVICPRDSPIEGSVETLKFLKERKIKIVIITGRMVSREDVWDELRRFGMDKYIDFVYTRKDNYEDGRKRTELIKEAMKRYNVKKEETIFVGDYWPDMQSGREAGVFTVGVLTGHENEEKLKKYGANIVVNSVKDLISLLRGNFRQKFK